MMPVADGANRRRDRRRSGSGTVAAAAFDVAITIGCLLGPAGCAPSAGQRVVHPAATSTTLGVGDRSTVDATERKFAYDSNDKFAIHAESLKARVVRIEVQHATGTAVGSGVVLCVSRGTVFVLTANHVLTGGGPPNEWGETPEPFRGVRAVEVSFYKKSPRAVSGLPRVLVAFQDPKHDVALLRFALASQATAPVVARPGSPGSVRTGDTIRSFGHSTVADKEWLPATGTVSEVRDFIIFQPALSTGYSGGPVFDVAGLLVGINSHVLADITEAVPIDAALAAVASGLPTDCKVGTTATTMLRN
jgi:S1-C subfamily serine protease